MDGGEGWGSLAAAGWVPPNRSAESATAARRFARELDRNLLEGLQAEASSDVPGCWASQTRRRRERIAGWIQRQLRAGAWLTAGVPLFLAKGNEIVARTTFPNQLVYWPRGIPAGPWGGILSSRLGRNLERYPQLFEAFRTACSQFAQNGLVLATSPKTVMNRFVAPAADLYGLRTLMLHGPPRGMDLKKWLDRLLKIEGAPFRVGEFAAFFSPSAASDQSDHAPGGSDTVPWRDRVVVGVSSHLFVLRTRRDGNIERLVRERLHEPRDPPVRITLALGDGLVRAEFATELIERSGSNLDVVVLPPGNHGRRSRVSVSPVNSGQAEPTACVFRSDLPDAWQYLTHFTRAPLGPWPDQTDYEYLCELLTAADLAKRTPFAALRRILAQLRIMATGRLLRGGAPAVCLTAIPPPQIESRRVFRPHRGRWDFEPYGICIRRDWLIGHGARPVIYGDDALWDRLTVEDRPFFQKRTTRPRGDGRTIDWTVEQEWRHLGDLDLGALPRESGLVFVPTAAEASELAVDCRWPIYVLPCAGINVPGRIG